MLTVNVEDRTIVVELKSGIATLREPTVGEWVAIRARYIEANEKIVAEGNEAADLQFGEEAPYAAALAHALGTLSDIAEPDPAQLPVGAATIRPYLEMAKLWQDPPVKIIGGPDDDVFTAIPEG